MALNAATVSIALGLTGVNAVTGGLSRVDAALGGVGRGVGGALAGIGTTLLAAGAAGAVALGGLGVAAGKSGVDFLALQETAVAAFTTMLGSGSQAQAFYDSLVQFAAITPFDLPGVLASSQKLLAFGFQAKDVIPDLTAIGNAVAAMGGGQGELDRIVLALGQMRAKGKVQGDEMLQLSEANIGAWQYLADFLHTDVPTAMKMVTKGLVTGQQGIDAILAGLNKDPKFANQMANQANTWKYLVTNMGDYWARFSAAIMQPVFDRVLKPGLQWLTTWLAGPGLALGTRLGTLLGDGFTRAGQAVAWLRGQFQAFRDVLGGGLGAGGIGGTLAVGFLLIRDTITNRVLPAIRLFWATFGAGVGKGVTFQGVVMGIVGVVERLGRWFQIGVDAAVTFKQALAGNWFAGQTASVNAFVRTIGRWTQLGRDAVLTFRQALAGDWFKNGSGNAFIDTIGRIGLALGDLKRTFDQGGFGAAFGKLWTDYLQPALTAAWGGITGWLGEKAPLIKAQLLTWGTEFRDWAGGIWTNNLQPEIGKLWTNFTNALTGQQVDMPAVGLQGDFHAGEGTVATGGLLAMFGGWLTALNNWGVTTVLPLVEKELGLAVAGLDNWVATTGYPLLKTAAGNLWAAFKDSLAAQPAQAMPIEDLAGNIIPQAGGYGFFADALNGAMTGLSDWAAGPGHQALMTVLGDLNTALLENSPAWLASWGGLWDGVKGLFTGFNNWLLEHTPEWLQTWSGLGTALGGALMAALRGILPEPIQRLLGLASGAGAPAGNQGGAGAGTGTGPGLNPGGTGGGLGGESGFTPTSFAPTIVVNATVNGPTTDQVVATMVQAVVDGVHGALTTALAPGGGGVTA
jgi:tape measure domain-containing protein